MYTLILNWRGVDDTLACITALRASSVRCALTVIDNGSDDGSVERLAREAPDLSLLSLSANHGFAGGMNAGLLHLADTAALPDYVWFLNNDAFVEPECLEHMLSVMNADPTVGAVAPVLVDAERTDAVEAWGGGRIQPWLLTTTAWHQPHRAMPDQLIGAALLVRRVALEACGAFDERFFFFHEDTDLSIRLRRAGWRLAVAERAIVRHRHGASVNRGSAGRSLQADLLYATSVGTFVAIHSHPIVRPFRLTARLVTMTAVRMKRRQVRHLPAVWRAYAKGIVMARRAPIIPRVGWSALASTLGEENAHR